MTHRLKRRIGAWIGLLALSLHLLVALGQGTPMAQAAGPGMSLSGPFMINCVTSGSIGGPIDDGIPPARSDCPVCLTQVLSGGLLLPGSVALPLNVHMGSVRTGCPDDFLTGSRTSRPFSSRAPPFAV